MHATTPTVDPRPAILEDLRTADRLVAGALATLRYARRQQRFDLVGVVNTEGAFDSQTQRDNASATSDLIEAEAALRRVEKQLSMAPTTAEIEVQHWSLWTDLAGGLFDLIPLFKLSANVETAERLQVGIRDLFAKLHATDAALATSVPPLADWDDGPSEIATSWAYNRPAMIVMGLGLIAFAIMMLS